MFAKAPPRYGSLSIWPRVPPSCGRPILATHASGQVHDIVKISRPLRHGIFEKVTALSASGKSQRWIAQELRVPKTFVQSALAGHDKRFSSAPKAPSAGKKSSIRAWHGASPYGFDSLDGQLHGNPRELRAVQKIVDFWDSGHGFSAITRELKGKARPRSGANWDHSLVSSLLRRISRREAPYDQLPPLKRSVPTLTRRSPRRNEAPKMSQQQPNNA